MITLGRLPLRSLLSPHSKLIDKIVELYCFFNYKVLGIEANSLGKAKSDNRASNFELVLRERQSAFGVIVHWRCAAPPERDSSEKTDRILAIALGQNSRYQNE
jgi:hypothetical protein